jgi:3-oxoadipate enol-lactonase
MHGIGGAAWSWRPQALALADRYRCYLWEARGHGAAAPVTGVTLSDYYRDAREALDLIRASHGAAPVVAAHSMGGLIALALGADAPEDVAGLFLLEPVYAPGGPPRSMTAFAPAARRVLEALAVVLPPGGALARGISRAYFRGSFTDRGAMENAWKEQRDQPIVEFPAMFIEGLEGRFTQRAFARELRVPALLLEGSIARRRPRFPELVDDLRFALGSRFRYEVVEGGHYLQLDRPGVVTRLLREFVAVALPAPPAQRELPA